MYTCIFIESIMTVTLHSLCSCVVFYGFQLFLRLWKYGFVVFGFFWFITMYGRCLYSRTSYYLKYLTSASGRTVAWALWRSSPWT